MYSSILELLCGQLDVLRPGGGAAAAPHAPELAAALKPLGELRAALEARLQVRLGGVASAVRPVVLQFRSPWMSCGRRWRCACRQEEQWFPSCSVGNAVGSAAG